MCPQMVPDDLPGSNCCIKGNEANAICKADCWSVLSKYICVAFMQRARGKGTPTKPFAEAPFDALTGTPAITTCTALPDKHKNSASLYKAYWHVLSMLKAAWWTDHRFHSSEPVSGHPSPLQDHAYILRQATCGRTPDGRAGRYFPDRP